MNDNVNKYIETNIKCIDAICKRRKKFEIKVRVLAVLSEIVILGAALLSTGPIAGLITYAAAVIIGAAIIHKESTDTRKCYEKEKEHLLELKDRKNIMFEEMHIKKSQKIAKHGLSIKSKEKKLKSLENVVGTFRAAIMFSTILTFTKPDTLWLVIALTGVYTAAGIYKVVKNADLEKERSEENILKREIRVDEILKEDNKEKIEVLVEGKEKEEAKELESIKGYNVNLSEKENVVEQIVEDLANQPSEEEEKNKVNIKK